MNLLSEEARQPTKDRLYVLADRLAQELLPRQKWPARRRRTGLDMKRRVSARALSAILSLQASVQEPVSARRTARRAVTN